jgi:hypothetical protein
MLQSYQPIVHDVLTRTAEINSVLGARAQATIGVSKEYADHLVEQLRSLAEQGKSLPGHLIEVSSAVSDAFGGVQLIGIGCPEDHHRSEADRSRQGCVFAGQVEQGRSLCHCECCAERMRVATEQPRTRSSRSLTRSTTTCSVPRSVNPILRCGRI